MNSLSELRPRILARPLLTALDRFPVVVLSGARQTGKTTLVTMPTVGAGRAFRTLDDLDVLERAQAAPDALLEDAPRLTLDEVQRAPSLLLAVKRAVDRKRTPGRFLLTGSANLLMMRRVSESLAGRAVYLDLWPMTEAEKGGHADPGPWSDWLAAPDARAARALVPPTDPRPAGNAAFDRLLIGGYPASVLARDPGERAAWFDGYVRTYLERDLRDLSAIGNLTDFRRLMRLAALRVGQVLNQSDLGRDAGLPQPTAHRYLDLLETSYQIVRLPPYSVSRTKRLVKAPKLYWTDVGLAAHLAGIASREALSADRLAGALVENLLLTHLLVWRAGAAPRAELHYWRTQTGEEVDFVLEAGNRLLPVEVKSARRVAPADARGLESFLAEHAKAAPFGLLLYGGEETLALTDRVVAVPLRAVWGPAGAAPAGR
ncbi:MAG: ATP-binding protein [Planctomycetes bacterium]|nr:ATP-binding protein [Planctomycetota bacterium]